MHRRCRGGAEAVQEGVGGCRSAGVPVRTSVRTSASRSQRKRPAARTRSAILSKALVVDSWLQPLAIAVLTSAPADAPEKLEAEAEKRALGTFGRERACHAPR